ncbi:hypothetical protein CYLTODRAFT_457000 [Cylindrobasidium torrendii FP15055 ss-10]|uniref:Uncharacterized protein n=1 Tax=Cylindrobasidium torrendii FP15055 ss-10 TaxID=1314674 RepID=A0A0D7B266_9AGAR|nr:hypothetical protein CYLTODRAFT_457000 [Cylindrobasidium torrendii FP15055 ss-10]
MTVEIYTEDCLSTLPHFGAGQPCSLILKTDVILYRGHESASGMAPGELPASLKQPINTLHVQSGVAEHILSNTLSFRPSESALEILYQLFQDNLQKPLEMRQRYNEVLALNSVSHVVRPVRSFKGDLFLRHPVTGNVTMHQHPYTDLPHFRLRTAHPVMTSLHALGLLFFTRPAIRRNDILYQMNQHCSKAYTKLCSQSSTSQTPNHIDVLPAVSCKRKRDGSDGDVHPCNKRSRRSIMLEPEPVIQVAAVLKRKASVHTECPPSKRGRQHFDMARYLPDHPRVGPSPRLRPSRAAKSAALAKIAPVRVSG